MSEKAASRRKIKVDNKIYLYEMLTTNLLQAMLVRRAEQSHQHWQSSNSALLMHWAHIQHIHIYCEDMTQLLHTYEQTWCSKSISFDFLINLHALQSHTLQRHDTILTHIHRIIATFLRTCCNSYTSHTHTLQRHDSAFAYLQTYVMQ